MTFDLVIFDCDGVLVDSEPIANRVFAEALNSIGLEIDYDEVCRRFIGRTMDHCVAEAEELLGRPVPSNFLEIVQESTFKAFRDEQLRAVDGVAELVDGLATPSCVASSGEIQKIRMTLGLTGLLERFEGRLFSAQQVERGKPFPDLFLHAARVMGADPSRCVVIEDSLPGVQAGCAAGMQVFGYAADGDGQALATAGARVIHAMAELGAILRQ